MPRGGGWKGVGAGICEKLVQRGRWWCRHERAAFVVENRAMLELEYAGHGKKTSVRWRPFCVSYRSSSNKGILCMSCHVSTLVGRSRRIPPQMPQAVKTGRGIRRRDVTGVRLRRWRTVRMKSKSPPWLPQLNSTQLASSHLKRKGRSLSSENLVSGDF